MMRLIKPYISFEDVAEEFMKVFETGWFTKGPNVDSFKRELCAYTTAQHAHLATSATTALSVCLKLLGIKPGDEVIVSDFSFPATANVVEDLYAVPVFADVDPSTFNMRPDELSRRLTRRTKAVIFVDALGNPSGLHDILDICRHHGLPLIEDAACALGSSEHGEKCGAVSDLTCFSFHPRKLLTTGEGGAILTDRDDWNESLAIMLEHGAKVEKGKFDFIEHGYNYRMTELQAVMGLAQLSKLDDIIHRRQFLRDRMSAALMPLGFLPQALGKEVVHNVQSLVYKVPPSISRDELIVYLKEAGIESTLGTYCLSGCTYYRSRYHDVQPIAENLQASTITLPCHDDVDPAIVCEAISMFMKGH